MSKEKKKPEPIVKRYSFYHNSVEYIVEARDGIEAREKINLLLKKNE